MIRIFGPEFDAPLGGLVEPKPGEYGHVFGGGSWKCLPPSPEAHPVLLLSLDCRDPLLSKIRGLVGDELPLCADLNCFLFESTAHYRFDASTHQVEFLPLDEGSTYEIDPELPFSAVLPARKASVMAMDPADSPVDEEAYWRICDEFLGGAKFWRVLGAPVWLTEPCKVACKCQEEMMYVSSIGYEAYGETSFIDDRSIFFGEFATYFFLCPSCSMVAIRHQSS